MSPFPPLTVAHRGSTDPGAPLVVLLHGRGAGGLLLSDPYRYALTQETASALADWLRASSP